MAVNPNKSSHTADTSYEIGKYKPPVEHRFKPGNKAGGRKKGSKNKDHLEDLLDQKVVIGHDSVGRPIRRTWRKVIDQQLLKKAAEGDLAAIKLVKEFELKRQALLARYPPAKTEAEKREEKELDQRGKEARETLVNLLDCGLSLWFDGILLRSAADATPLVYDALREYREKRGFPPEPLPGQSWNPWPDLEDDRKEGTDTFESYLHPRSSPSS